MSWAISINGNIWGYNDSVGNSPVNIHVPQPGAATTGQISDTYSLDGAGQQGGYVTYDLEPYLQQGINTIEMDEEVGGGGEGYAYFAIDPGSATICAQQ